MRKLIAEPFVTLDGVVEMSHNWTAPYVDREVAELMQESAVERTAMLMGRGTYEAMAWYWPEVSAEDDPIAGYMNTTTKFVVSNTIKSVDWENSTLISGDVMTELKDLKESPGGDISIPGSGTLVRSLLGQGLLDELRPLVFPLILGTGDRLFDGWDGRLAMRLVASRSTDNGVLAPIYEPVADEAAQTQESQELPPGVAAPARRALLSIGINTLQDLAQHSRHEIAALHGVGTTAIDQLEEALEAQGLAFR